MQESFEIELLSKLPSKKNQWRPRKGGGIRLDRRAQDAIKRISMQVPGYLRDLKLVSPDVDFYLTYTAARGDRDNQITCAIDILVKMGVFADDRIGVFNGRLTIHPAVRGDYDGCRIVITPQGEQEKGETLLDDQQQPESDPAPHGRITRTPTPAR